ncbi:MAG: hypothetical protein J1F31_02555 [Erysipelotrichales bacterium]|nr:hypothetical protein [Erysipelotrichales bacterium]
MKNFFKTALIVLFVGIVIASIAGSRSVSSNNNSALTSIIDQFEDNVANGGVIQDGIIDGATSVDEIVVASNGLASLFNKLGSMLVSGIGKLIKLAAELITKFIG